jgi:UDP-glucose 4-epimerase
MTTVIAGGAGFVGLNIAEALLKAGEAVTIVDADEVPAGALRVFAHLPGSLRCFQADVTDAAQLGPVFAAGADHVVCGAAVTASPDRDGETPERTLSVNLNGTLNLLRAAHDARSRRVINLSSAGAYGAAAFRHDLLEEDATREDPASVYSVTKFASERIGDCMARAWGLDVINVRLAGVFGRWERKTSVRDTPSPQFQVMQAALRGEPALVARRDNRDWVYGPDVARAVIALRNAEKLNHTLYNISSGERWAIADWGAGLADRVPGFVCRLATESEQPNISLHSATDRGQLSTKRLVSDTNFATRYGFRRSLEDYHDWSVGIAGSYP